MQNEMRDRQVLEYPEKMCEYCCNFDKEHIGMDCTALCKLTMTLAYAEDYGGNCMFYNVPKEQIIVPPCKVGDVVYCEYGEKIIFGKVNLIRPFISENDVVFKGNIICELESPFYDDGRKEESELYVVFGRKWGIERVAYSTKEEAEQALKGGKQE